MRQRAPSKPSSHTAQVMLHLIKPHLRNLVRSFASRTTFQAALGYQAEHRSGALDEARVAGVPG